MMDNGAWILFWANPLFTFASSLLLLLFFHIVRLGGLLLLLLLRCFALLFPGLMQHYCCLILHLFGQ